MSFAPEKQNKFKKVDISGISKVLDFGNGEDLRLTEEKCLAEFEKKKNEMDQILQKCESCKKIGDALGAELWLHRHPSWVVLSENEIDAKERFTKLVQKENVVACIKDVIEKDIKSLNKEEKELFTYFANRNKTGILHCVMAIYWDYVKQILAKL